MSVSLIPDAQKGASEEQTSIQKMLIENGRLIECIAEYQRLGRPTEAMKYQELLHRNLLYLGRLVDPQLEQQIKSIQAKPAVETPAEAQEETGPSSNQPATSSANGAINSPESNQDVNGTMTQQYPVNGAPVMTPTSTNYGQTSPSGQQEFTPQ